jgi:hypothetical protein
MPRRWCQVPLLECHAKQYARASGCRLNYVPERHQRHRPAERIPEEGTCAAITGSDFDHCVEPEHTFGTSYWVVTPAMALPAHNHTRWVSLGGSTPSLKRSFLVQTLHPGMSELGSLGMGRGELSPHAGDQPGAIVSPGRVHRRSLLQIRASTSPASPAASRINVNAPEDAWRWPSRVAVYR